LLVDEQGEFSFVVEGSVDGEKLTDKGIVQSFSFGPVLVENGQTQPIETNFSKTVNPRTAIGMVEPLHYIIIVADGRTSESVGMRLETLANEFVKRGVLMAYNLDGGGSSTLWFNGKVLNNPTTDGKWIGERKVSDILYFGY
jgi:exopolysaccharide biosynthesis protein